MPVVDKFNVEGNDYYIEPLMDNTPTQGSEKAVSSGGVYGFRSEKPAEYDKKFLTSGGAYADKSEEPIGYGTLLYDDEQENHKKNFTAGGAFDFFGNATSIREWYPMMFPNLMGNVWHWRHTSAFSGQINVTCRGYTRGSILIGTNTGAGIISHVAYYSGVVSGIPANTSVDHIICPNGIALFGTYNKGLFYADLRSGTFSPTAYQCVGIPTTDQIVALRYVKYFGGRLNDKSVYIALTSSAVWVSTDAINWERATGFATTDTFKAGSIYSDGYDVYILSAQRRIYQNSVTGDISWTFQATIGTEGTAVWLSRVDGYLVSLIDITSSTFQYYIYARNPPSMNSGTHWEWQPASTTYSGDRWSRPFSYMGSSYYSGGRMRVSFDTTNGYKLVTMASVIGSVVLNGVAFGLDSSGSNSYVYRRNMTSNTSDSQTETILKLYTSMIRSLTYADGVLYALCSDGTVIYSSYQDIMEQLNLYGSSAICRSMTNTDLRDAGYEPKPN